MSAGAGLELLQLRLGGWIGRGTQLLQQRFDGRNVVGHLAGKAEFGPMGVAKPLGLLPAQSEDFLDQRSIVQVSLAGTADMGSINGLPQ